MQTNVTTPYNQRVLKNYAKSLSDDGLILRSVDELTGNNLLDTTEWSCFTFSWNDLPTDRYMNDGGTYRQRRFSRFHLDLETMTLRQKEHAPYSQPEHLNPLNGGMLRHFDPMLPSTVEMGVFQDLLTNIGMLLGKADMKDRWDINVYQNRTLASNDVNGKPVPEGMHRDGVRYSVLMGIGRHNVVGAESTIFDDDRKPMCTHTVTEGDVLIFCDETCYHDTTDIKLLKQDRRHGTRDVMVIEYYTSLGNENQIYVE